MGTVTSTSTRLVAAVAIFGANSGQNLYHRGAQKYTGWCETNHFLLLLRGSAPPWQVQFWRARVPAPHVLNVDGLLPRLANCRQRIACALFLFDPLLFVADDVEQQLSIFCAGQI